jgi:heat shock protein HspQ
MINSLPKSLIETATSILRKSVMPFAYVSFRDVYPEHNLNEEHIDAWTSTNKENSRNVLNHLMLDHTHTEDDKTHAFRYTSASKPLNKMLYNLHKEGNKNVPEKMDITGSYNFTHDIPALDAAIHRNKTEHDLTTYSGISWHPHKKMDDSGNVFLPAYTSTSTSKSVAHGFSKNNKPHDTDVHILKIHHPVGSTGLYTHDDPTITQYVGENEFIMPRNSVIKVNPTPEVYEDDNHTVHVWTAHRQNKSGLPGKETSEPGRTELFNNGKLKMYKTNTLSAFKQHYPEFHRHDYGESFHQHHVTQPVLHIHTPDNNVWQSHLEGTEMIFRPAKGSIKATAQQVLEKYPELNKFKDYFVRKDVERYNKD